MAYNNLSLIEIFSYLESQGIFFKIISVSNKVLILKSKYLKIDKIIRRLAGVYKIGIVLNSFKENNYLDSRIINVLDNFDISYNSKKLKWGISQYNYKNRFTIDLCEWIKDQFERNLKHMGINKFKFINPTITKDNNYEIISDEIIRRKLLEKGFEILIVYSENIAYVAKTLAVIDNQDYIKRDKERPFQNPKLNISPKLARILINLAGLKKNDVLFDPFCGLGTILQEAIILGITSYGSDIEYDIVLKARKNINWLINDYKIKAENISSGIFRADARKITKIFSKKVDGIVTEPLLIPPLRKFPSLSEARKMLKISEGIYRNSIREVVKNLKKGGRLIIVIPIIRFSSKEEISFNPEKYFSELGLKPYVPHSYKFAYPIKMTYDDDQKVLRKIYLLEKT